jgi:hypothetical protein
VLLLDPSSSVDIPVDERNCKEIGSEYLTGLSKAVQQETSMNGVTNLWLP